MKSGRLRKQLDRKFAKLLSTEALQIPPLGWIKSIRTSIGMRGAQLAKRLGVTPQNIALLERQEIEGRIKITTLRQVAEALNCDLYYCLVPRESLQKAVEKRAVEVAQDQLGKVSDSMSLEGQAVNQQETEEQIEEFADQLVRSLPRVLWE